MKFHWENARFRIRQHSGGRISSAWVSGVCSSGFGIHDSGEGWNVTHLRTGWKAFTCVTAYGAQTIAEHLIENYQREFALLKISGFHVENFYQLERKVQADEELRRLRRVLCINRSELKQMGAADQPKMVIVS